ncbi:WGR domain-containing protein [Nodosilinea sp. AN01ver1]|uniref:WGR domain-containing protein n=1 Tax=Nodosilinea sp. AN01ver1 TaxID=3423362 RepID=UPI003D320FE9
MTQLGYAPAQEQELFWQRGDRFYWCALRQNLFGEWVLLRRWGGRRTGKGGQSETCCADLVEGNRLMQDVLRRRRSRGYVLIR